ncbi:DUF6731 family protein [Synechococcus sp. 1G10]|uniref:DUF6731 family protein n=1 Tax=Synechococcus sp. 1G10 TaxID=2025605 RepID=UPI00117DC09E|nr:DUF6731 family protein [Synechococcus sp. 1G10]
MKVYAYKVSLRNDWTHPINQAFRVASEKPLETRLIQLSSSRIRLEDAIFSGGQVFANFALFRSGSGPAIVSESTHLSEVDIRDDQFFGEDTACLYDPLSGYILVQYNHHGPKASAIQEYLSFANDGLVHSYLFTPKLSPSSEQQIQSLAVVSRVEVSFAIPNLTSHPGASGLSFGSAVDIASANGAETLSLVIGNRRGLTLSAAKDLALSLYRAFSCGEGIKRLALKAQVDDDSPRETIDLIAERLCGEEDVPLGVGRRYSVQDRWSTMARLLRSWRDTGFLT